MKKLLGQVSIALLALMIGLIISIEIKNHDKESTEGLLPLSKVQKVASEYDKIHSEKEAASEELIAIEAKIKNIENSQATQNFLVKNLISDIDRNKMIAGIVDVKGPGITITINDPPVAEVDLSDYSTIMNQYHLLLLLINKLNDAGAEAISINDQRIIARTNIVLGDKLNPKNLIINGIPTIPPFVIKAIGDPKVLKTNISIKYGIIDEMQNVYELQVKVVEDKQLIINRYNDTIKFKYTKTVQ